MIYARKKLNPAFTLLGTLLIEKNGAVTTKQLIRTNINK
jgi:hypothetical protein